VRILASYNIKGGVGKTAAAVNLAYLAAQAGRRTLIWDLDPQAAATFYLRIRPKVKGGGKGLVKGKRELEDLVKATDFEHLDLLPADFSFRNMDLVLEEEKKPTKQLLRLLRSLSDEYDLVVLDCPPSISLVSENVFRAADLLLVPVIPTTLSARTLEQLLGFLEGHKEASGLRVMPFFSMVDRRKRLHAGLMAELPRQFPGFLTTSIPYASEVERMGVHRMPLTAYAPGSPAGRAYAQLWREVEAALAAS
jgi:cellulose biosynthesis protein BcsQ